MKRKKKGEKLGCEKKREIRRREMKEGRRARTKTGKQKQKKGSD